MLSDYMNIDLSVIGQARCAIKIIWNSFIKTVYISSGMDYNYKVYPFRKNQVMCNGK